MRGHVAKRKWKRGVSYSAVVDASPDPKTGKRRQRWATFKTRREAEAYLQMVLARSQIAGGVPSSKVRLGEYLDAWLEGVKVSVRSTTFVTYSYAVRRHIVPELGGVPLPRLTAEAIEVWVSRLQSTGLSGSTVHQAFRVLKTALRQAVARGIIARESTRAGPIPEGAAEGTERLGR